MTSSMRTNTLRSTAITLFCLAGLFEIAVSIISVVLGGQHAPGDPSSRPHEALGYLVLLAGSVQSAVIVAIGRIAMAVGEMRPD